METPPLEEMAASPGGENPVNIFSFNIYFFNYP